MISSSRTLYAVPIKITFFGGTKSRFRNSAARPSFPLFPFAHVEARTPRQVPDAADCGTQQFQHLCKRRDMGGLASFSLVHAVGSRLARTLGGSWRTGSLETGTISVVCLNGDHQSLLAHDEGFYAVQARWIWESGDWLTPQWWGKPIYDRTIGIQWLMALSYHLFGLNEFSARLPSTIACIFSVLLTYELGLILFDQKIAWLGAAILMLMGLWVSEAHTAQQNTALVAIELLGILSLLKITDLRSYRRLDSRYNWLWGSITGATVGWGFIIKGFMIFVPMVALIPYVLSHQHYRKLLVNPGIYLGLIIVAES